MCETNDFGVFCFAGVEGNEKKCLALKNKSKELGATAPISGALLSGKSRGLGAAAPVFGAASLCSLENPES